MTYNNALNVLYYKSMFRQLFLHQPNFNGAVSELTMQAIFVVLRDNMERKYFLLSII